MILRAVFIVTCVLYYLWHLVRKPKNFPPGPPWKPIVGSLPYYSKFVKELRCTHVAFSALSKQWNTSILGLKLGNQIVVVVEDYPTIKQVLTSQEYEQRPTNFFVTLRNMGTCKGITCAEGELWSEHRKFVTSYLRIIGRNSFDAKINHEIRTLIREIDSKQDAQIGKLLPSAVINSLWSVVAGNRVESETFEQNQLLNMIYSRAKAFDMCGGTLAQHSWLRFIIPEKSGYNLVMRLNKELKYFLMKIISNHYREWTIGNNSDFIYSFIGKIKTSNGDTTFTREQLFFVCLDLFIGGFSTVTYTLDYFFLMMVLHQDVQSQMQKLLDKTFDDNQPIVYQDRQKVPYVEAVIREVQRYVNSTPLLGPRRTIRDTTLAGYTIPKNTTILMNIVPMLMSKEIWGDPHTFRPERFLNEQGELISYREFIPFGLGRRKCLGDTFAQQCLFLFVTELLRTFKISPIDENNPPTITPVPGLFLSPTPYFARFTRRR